MRTARLISRISPGLFAIVSRTPRFDLDSQSASSPCQLSSACVLENYHMESHREAARSFDARPHSRRRTALITFFPPAQVRTHATTCGQVQRIGERKLIAFSFGPIAQLVELRTFNLPAAMRPNQTERSSQTKRQLTAVRDAA